MSVFKYSNTITVSKSVPTDYTTVEYFFSSHDGDTALTEAETSATWAESPEGWVSGQYIWIRSVNKTADGTVLNRSEAKYDATLTAEYEAKKRWQFRLDKDTYYYNARQPASLVITVSTDIQYYGSVTPLFYADDTAVTLTDSKITITAFTGADISIRMVHPSDSTVEYDVTVTVQDITEYGYCFGAMQRLPSNPIDGDYFVAKSTFTANDVTYTEGVPYVYKDSKWIALDESADEFPVKMSAVLSSVLNDGSITVPSTSALYGYFETIATNSIVADKIYANDIQSKVYENGVKGYKLSYVDGKISAVLAEFTRATITTSTIEGDSTVYGTIINRDDNDNVVFKTNKDTSSAVTVSGSAVDGETTPDAFLWSDWKSLLISWTAGLTDKTVYSVSDGYVNSQRVYNIARFSSLESDVSSPKYSNSSGAHVESVSYVYDNRGCAKNFTLSKLYIVRTHSQSTNIFNSWDSAGYLRVYQMDNSGNKSYLYNYTRNNDTGSKQFTIENYVVNAGCILVIESGDSDQLGNNIGSVTGFSVQAYWCDADNWKVGVNVVYGATSYGLLSDMSSTGYGTSSQTFAITGFGTKTLQFSASASWEISKYYSLHYSSSPSNSNNITSSFFSSKSFSINSTAYTVGSITYSNSAISIIAEGAYSTFVLSSSDYLLQYSFSFSLQSTVLGAFAKNLMPTTTTGSIGGSADDSIWHSIYGKNIYYQNMSNLSKREYKDDIQPFTDNAVDIVNGVDVVSYVYKSDEDKNYQIGFIADDTDWRLAGVNHDKMDLSNCIGVLIKAVQELKSQIDEIKSDIYEYTDGSKTDGS